MNVKTTTRFARRAAAAVLFGAALLAAPATVSAQSSYYFPQATAADFDPAIPTPEAFLGYPVGSHYTRHDQIVAYLKELERLSDRVTVETIGSTYEHRPLLSVVITSASNQSRIDDIQRVHASVADTNGPAITADQPVVVGLFYSVHGNETSSGEAMLMTAYYLAASRSPETLEWLDKAVIVIDPSQNPDGRDRAANWHNAWKSNPASSDPQDKEHVEAWPAGRINHYFTDLNRDWLAITQTETRAKLEAFHRWKPNFQIDFHEMGAESTYYFEPSPASMESPLLPRAAYEWNVTLAKYHAQALDNLGSLYLTREVFDNFSPVYGSTYPDFHGGIGVTVEQASSRGLVQETSNGPLTFPFTIRNQTNVGLATIRGAVAERAGLLAFQRDFFRSAVDQGRRHTSQAFVFGDPANSGLTRQTLELLQAHRIQVYPLNERITQDGRTFEPGSAYVVPSAQPQFRLIHSIFDRTPPTKGSVYGSTSYSIALAYNLNSTGLRRVPAIGTALTAIPAAQGGVSGPDTAYAYAVDWRDQNAPRLLATLLQKDVRVRTAFEPFTSRTGNGETRFERGSLVITASGQSLDAATLRQTVDEAAREAGVTAYGLGSGQVISGVDLGSNSVKVVRAPRIALVVGEGVNATEIGSTWFALSERLHYPTTRLDPSQLGRIDLDNYDSIVLSGGRYDGLGQPAVDAIKAWVRRGGSLVVFGSATTWAATNGLAPQAEREEAKDDKADDRRDYADRSTVQGEQRTAGNALSADADITHPLAFGLSRRDLFVNKETAITLTPVADPFANVVRIDAEPQVNGYLPDALRRQAAGSVWAQVNPIGSGTVVLFADDPAHRKYWLGTERLLINSLFFGNHLATNNRR
ncbi:M14 family metallopeptidase [Brevundimonas sp.]|uniref:M14 family metallopeptidase n=1 Tax=Brevundimonas sp. TaxID=1871086 RepID=UPI002FC63DAE